MSRDVSGELSPGTVPTAVPLRLWLQTGALAKKGEHAFRLKLEEVLGIEVLRPLQWAAGEAHAAQRQRDGLELDLFRNLLLNRFWGGAGSGLGMRERERLQTRAKNEYLNSQLSHATSRGVNNKYKIVYIFNNSRTCIGFLGGKYSFTLWIDK